MDTSVPHGIDWLAPWQAIENGSGLEAELRRAAPLNNDSA